MITDKYLIDAGWKKYTNKGNEYTQVADNETAEYSSMNKLGYTFIKNGHYLWFGLIEKETRPRIDFFNYAIMEIQGGRVITRTPTGGAEMDRIIEEKGNDYVIERVKKPVPKGWVLVNIKN